MSAPLILPANTVVADDLRVQNALNFLGASNTSSRFQRTNSADGSSTQATLSAWVKYSADVSQSVPIFMAPDAAGNDRLYIQITSAEEMGGTHRSPDCDFSSTDDVKLRDPAAWYHIVAAINTSDSTAADRIKIYVNNERITLTFATGGGLGSGANIHFNRNGFKNIFGYNDITNDGVSNLTDMYFAEVIKCDGQVLAPTDFAEYDDDGVWVPKTGLADSLTFGTTGYYYNFADSSDLGNDVSGNGNDASDVSNTTQSLDTPSNSFAVLNTINAASGGTFNIDLNRTRVKGADTIEGYTASTLGFSKGKWYFECETNFNTQGVIGITFDGDTGQVADDIRSDRYPGNATYSYGYILSSGNKVTNSSSSSYGNSLATGDILGVAIDLDNGFLYFSKNGTFQNSGDPTSGSSGTGGIALTGSGSTGFCFVTVGDNNNAGYGQIDFNFGSPFFSISSGNSDGNGYGNFEYSVPSGYYALNSKNLAEYG